MPEQIFREWLRHVREKQELSQTALAAKVGLDPTALTKIEKGTRSVRLNEAVSLASALGQRLEDMVSEKPPPSLRELLAAAEARVQQLDDALRQLGSDKKRAEWNLDRFRNLVREEARDDGEHQETP